MSRCGWSVARRAPFNSQPVAVMFAFQLLIGAAGLSFSPDLVGLESIDLLKKLQLRMVEELCQHRDRSELTGGTLR